ncbi:DUF317 domain-containing protein [Kitasatospora phosalacinea]|uniref:DUF317 domain-containing protein n=1 Tax=Kitasatospora phosalacinea TaxID=2065 RepID=A0A9W6USH9_9ACTN|nr:DUF317 domain-containing protein [Kitasatospora phosalacinea]GLW58152.1 hypothetical protein Kpho01_61630 [Kitasatospora phosalacinea]
MTITTPLAADGRIPVAPRRLAGPGEPEALWPVLTERGWSAAPGQGVLLASGCRRLQLATLAADDRTTGWQLRAAEQAGHPPLWTIAFTAVTPVEIVAAVAVHLDEALAKDGPWALHGYYPVPPLFSALHAAGWEDLGAAGLASPEHGPLGVALWHEPSSWSAPDVAVLTITAGHQGNEDDFPQYGVGEDDAPVCGFSVGLSNRVPDTVAAAVMGAVLDPAAVHRLPQDIPVPHREAVAHAGRAPAPLPAAEARPSDALAPLASRAWRVGEDEVGDLSLRSPCGRITVLHLPEPRPGQEHAYAPWIVRALGDEGDGWEAEFGPGTPVAVVAAFTARLAATVAHQDATALYADWLHNPEPNFTTPRVHRTHPVEGSFDARLAHTRLRLAGWTAHDHSFHEPGRVSCAPTNSAVLFAFPPSTPAPVGLPALPRQWKLTGRIANDQPERWEAVFGSRTPTELVLAAAHQAAALPAVPLRPQPIFSRTAEAAQARATDPAPPSSRQLPCPSGDRPDQSGTPPTPPRRR